jgi:integration host factor subunit beta
MLRGGARITMTKAELVEEVTQLGDLTRRDGEVIVDTIFDAVIGALKSGDKIEIRGFGSFRIRQRKPRIGRNPKTGAKVDVPAKRVPYFKPSKELRDLVNPGEAAGHGHSPEPEKGYSRGGFLRRPDFKIFQGGQFPVLWRRNVDRLFGLDFSLKPLRVESVTAHVSGTLSIPCPRIRTWGTL